MDEFGSLISLQEDDAFLFQHTVPAVSLEQQTIKQDLVIPGTSLSPVLERNELTVDKKGKKQRKSSAVKEDGNGGAADNKQKRIVHRDIERQRRQEMAHLYGSLRTLLPLEYIRVMKLKRTEDVWMLSQGKRSICDQVNETVNYIKYQEKNIKQLQSKRDKLRNSSDASDTDAKEGSSRNSSPIEISFRPCSHGGIEILISNEVGEERCPISCVLKVLVEEGLTVVSCFCTKVNDKFLYTIQTEASHITLDIHILPQKLSHRIKAPINFKCYSST